MDPNFLNWLVSLISAELGTILSVVGGALGTLITLAIRFFRSDLQNEGFWGFLNPALKYRHRYKNLDLLLQQPTALTSTIQIQQDLTRMYLTHGIEIAPILHPDLIAVSTDTHRNGIQWLGLRAIQNFIISTEDGASSRIHVNGLEGFFALIMGTGGILLFAMSAVVFLAIALLFQVGAYAAGSLYIVPLLIGSVVTWYYLRYTSHVLLALHLAPRYQALLARSKQPSLKDTSAGEPLLEANPTLATEPTPTT